LQLSIFFNGRPFHLRVFKLTVQGFDRGVNFYETDRQGAFVGKPGRAVVEAIIGGERNVVNFLPLIDGRIKADHETIQKSLEGELA